MSTPGNPSDEPPTTPDADTSVSVKDPHEHHWFSEPTKEVGPKYVVVLVNGSTVVLGDVTPYARALLEAWLGGQAAGGAIADVLTGVVNPSGRLAETIPHRLEDNSSYFNFPGDSQVVRYGEGLFMTPSGAPRVKVASVGPTETLAGIDEALGDAVERDGSLLGDMSPKHRPT